MVMDSDPGAWFWTRYGWLGRVAAEQRDLYDPPLYNDADGGASIMNAPRPVRIDPYGFPFGRIVAAWNVFL